MGQAVETNRTQAQLDELSKALSSGTFVNVRHMLNALPATDIARLLEALDAWEAKDNAGDIMEATMVRMTCRKISETRWRFTRVAPTDLFAGHSCRARVHGRRCDHFGCR